MNDAATQPLDIELNRTKELRIRWSDGAHSVISLTALRKACPCAGCRAEHEQATGQALPIVPDPVTQQHMAEAEQAQLVGNYALRVRWKDGHDTGIYDYGLLRSLGVVRAGGGV